ncbi:hypothetical protein FQN53_009187 [Emmonsiellopsis sp. PD_33]|nr:hypothetical protein FQN53_009187 [Emmonsiellopsis sp. PD_33]
MWQRPVSYEFSLVNMYRDRDIENQHDIEAKLSRLESTASEIIARAVKIFESEESNEPKLTRSERDTLREYLSLVKNRNTISFTRYNHDRFEAYDCDDEAHMEQYIHAGKKVHLSERRYMAFSLVDQQAKMEIRMLREALFMELSIQRVWLYIKIYKNLNKSDMPHFKGTGQMDKLELQGKENEIAGARFNRQFVIGVDPFSVAASALSAE